MNKKIKKIAVDIQSLILCMILSLIVDVPCIIMAIILKSSGILIISLILLFVSLLLMLWICFSSKKIVIFNEEGVSFLKNGKKLKSLFWSEIEIEYLGLNEILFLRCFTIRLSYFDNEKKEYAELLIPSNKQCFYEIMRERKKYKS